MNTIQQSTSSQSNKQSNKQSKLNGGTTPIEDSNNSQDLLARIDTLIEEHHILTHPFYQAWNEGTLPKEALKAYAAQYYKHVDAFPQYLASIYANCSNNVLRKEILANLIEEDSGEENHPELWRWFAEGIGVNRDHLESCESYMETRKAIEDFRAISTDMHAAAGMAAMYAYEAMVPETAQSKIDGLKKHYSIDDEKTLAYFQVHESLDRKHRAINRQLIGDLIDDAVKKGSDVVALKEACESAAKSALDAVWSILSGVHDRHCVAA